MAELERFFDRWGRRFGETTDDWEDEFGWLAFGSMAVDVLEYDDRFVVAADLPGFERDEIEVTVTDHTVRIEAEREPAEHETESEGEAEEEEPRYLRHERRHDETDRSIRLPEDVDTETTSASLAHGVLTVTLPKLDVEEAHSIDIE
jgi:HSP20 family protein